MGCDKCGAEPAPGASYQLTAKGKLCPTCAAPAFVSHRGRCGACQQGVDPTNPRTRVARRLDGRVLCGYCGPAADAAFRRADRPGARRGWKR